MKDIFEILQHETHELELIKYGEEYVLGCKTCGKTLLTEQFVAENVDEYKKILDTLQNQEGSEHLLNSIKMLGLHMLSIGERGLTCLQQYVLSDLADFISRDYITKSNRVSATFNIMDLLDKLYKNAYCIENYRELINACFSETAWEAKTILIKDKLLTALNENVDTYKFFDDYQTYTTGCVVYKINHRHNKKQYFFAINNELAKELEKECPTPIDVYVFKDINDFYDKEPDYEDEEEESNKYKEYIYRMENHLYDFRNIGVDFIIKNAIEYYADYDYVDRFVIPLKKVLQERYNIEL